MSKIQKQLIIKNTLTKRTILLCCTIIVLLLFFEIVLRVFYPFYSNYNTEMWRYAVESKKISLFPGLGHEHVPNKSNQLYGVEIRTNSDGSQTGYCVSDDFECEEWKYYRGECE